MVLGRNARAAGRIHGNGKLRAEGLAQQGVRNDADIRAQADELHAVDFARRARSASTEVVALTKPGMAAHLTFSKAALDIHIIEPPKDLDELPPAPARRPNPHMGENDPFADSDLPVQID